MKNRWLIILGGSLLYAIAVCTFIIPNSVVLGGTSGFAVLIQRFIPFLSSEQIITILNAILTVLAFLILDRKKAFGTLVGSIFTTFFIFLFDLIWKDFSGLHISAFFESIIGSVLIGAATFLLFRFDASSGGTDIVAQIVQHYRNINISTALLISDVALVALSFLAYGLVCGALSVCGFFAKIGSIAALERVFRKTEKASHPQ